MKTGELALTGTFLYNLDRKGRLVIPAHHRTALGDTVVLTTLPGGWILALPPTAWQQALRNLYHNDGLRTYLLSGAHALKVDATTGRVLIPWELRDHAALQPLDTVAVVGQGLYLLIGHEDIYREDKHAYEAALLAAIAAGVLPAARSALPALEAA